MLPTTILLPCPFAASALGAQEPKPVDSPAGAAPTPGATGTPSASGTLQTDPNAQQPTAPAGGFANDIFLYMALFVGLMLFMSFRRESKSRKQQQSMLSSIKQGDRVVTSSGIHATVHKLEDKTVTLMLDSAQVTFDRSAIARVVRDPETPKTA